MSTSLLQLENVGVSYGAKRAVGGPTDGVDLRVDTGELLVLLGPSGCGKSTLLRAIAGLQPLDRGRVLLNGHDLAGKRPDERSIGLMFQAEVLFPHYDVAGNVEFGLRMRRWSYPQRKLRVREMLKLVGLAGFGKRDVATLSGGEAQRVGLARSLAPRPDVLLLDEPFGALDRPLRERLVDELGPLLAAQGVTAIHVTHDHDEAFALGHRLAVMFDGTLGQVGSPEQVWSSPRLVEVARFLGHKNTFEIAQWEQISQRSGGRSGGGAASKSGGGAAGGVGSKSADPGSSHIVVRADLIDLRPISASEQGTTEQGAAAAGTGTATAEQSQAAAGISTATAGTGSAGSAVITGTVSSCRFAGERYEVQVEVGTAPASPAPASPASADTGPANTMLAVHSRYGPQPGTRVALTIPADALIPLAG